MKKRIIGEVVTFLLAIVVVYLFMTRAVTFSPDVQTTQLAIELTAQDESTVSYYTDASVQARLGTGGEQILLSNDGTRQQLLSALNGARFSRILFGGDSEFSGGPYEARQIVRIRLFSSDGTEFAVLTLVRGADNASRMLVHNAEGLSGFRSGARYTMKSEPSVKAQLLQIIDEAIAAAG